MKLALKVVGLLAISALHSRDTCIGGGYQWSSQLSGTNWTSATVTTEQANNGVSTSTFVMHFATATTSSPTSDGGSAVGPFTGTLTQVYGTGANAGSRAGCTETTMFMGATWTENSTQSLSSMNMGGASLSGEVSSTMRTGCMQTSSNGMDSSNTLYTDNGGTENFTVTGGSMMTMTGNAVVPFYGSGVSWAFEKVSM